MALEYGINFNTEEGRRKAEKEIKKWIGDFQGYLDKNKLDIGLGTKDNKGGGRATLVGYRKELQDLRNEYKKLTTAELASGSGNAIISKYKQLREQVGIYGGTLDQAAKALDKLESQANKTTPTIDRQTQAFKRQSDVMVQLKSYAMNFLSVYAGIRMIKNLATITGEFEMQRVSLQAILQDAEKGTAIFERIKELAVVSPFQFKDLVSYTKQLSAFSIPYEDLYQTTKELADLSAGLGVGMDRLILAYGQVRSAAVLRGQELRQFTEAGIPLVEELRKKLSEANGELVTTGEVFEYISARKVPFAMVRDIISEMTSEGGKFYMMQEKQAETLKGKIANLTDAYEIMMANIGNADGGIMKGAVDAVRSLIENYEAVGKILTTLVITYGTYRAAVIVATIAERGWTVASMAQYKWLLLVEKAQKLLNATMLKNPFVAITAAVVGLSTAFILLRDRSTAAEVAQKKFNDTLAETQELADKERAKITELVNAVKDETKTRRERQLKLNELQRLYPDIFKNLDLEAAKNINLAEAIRGVNEVLEDKADLQSKDRVIEITRELVKLREEHGKFIFAGDESYQVNNLFKIKELEEERSLLVKKRREDEQATVDAYKDLADWQKIVSEFVKANDAQSLAFSDEDGTVYTYIKRIRDEYADLTEKYKIYSGLVDEGSKKQAANYKQQITLAEQLAATMGFSLKDSSGSGDNAKKEQEEAERRLKEYLNRIHGQINEYREKFKIWDTIYQDSGKKPAIDFEMTFNGDPNVAEYIKSKMQQIGGGQLKLDVDFLTADFSDILSGATFDDTTLSKLKDLFKELQDSSFSDYKGLTELYDKYADYTAKKLALDRKYIRERDELLRTGATESVQMEQLRIYREESEHLVDEFAKKDEAFNNFVTSLANSSVDKLRFLLMELQASLTKETVTGGNSETILMLKAKISALEKELSNSKIDKSEPRDLEDSYKQWRRLQTVLSKVGSEFEDIGRMVGGVAGDIISLAGSITTSTLSMINGITMLANWSIEATKKTAEGTSKAIQAVEKASVILAIISAALQVATKIWDFISRTNEVSEEVIQRYKAFIDVTNRVKNAQKELIATMSGGDAKKTQEETLRIIEKQRDAVKEMTKEYLKSGGGLFKRSYGRKMSQDLEGYRGQLAKIGISYDKLGTYFTGLVDLSSDELQRIQKELPMFWASLTPELRDYLDQLIEITESTEELEKATREATTGLAFDDLLGGFEDFIDSADNKSAILAENFEDHMLQAIMNIVKTQYLTDELGRWYKQMESVFGNDTLTEAEKESLRKEYERIMIEGERRLNTALDVAGLKRDSTTNLTGISKGISNITEDTALILGGYLDSIRFKLFQYIDFMMLPENRPTMSLLIQSQATMINHLQAIELNTNAISVSNAGILDNINKVMVSTSDGWKLNVNA